MDQEKKAWVHAGKVEDFPEGEKVERILDRRRVLLLRQQGKWYGFEALCPHMSRSLRNSRVEGDVLECIWHNMRFNIETGAVVYESGFIGIPDLKVYEIKIEKEDVYVKIEDEPGLIRRSF
jgi:nitrite reductase/ring-hydroxylating ferredoxin subunit